MDMEDVDFEIFDEETSKKIKDEHERDMDNAVKAVGAHRMGLITKNGGQSSSATPAAGKGLMSKLSSATSLLSWKKKAGPAPTSGPSEAPPTTTAQAPTAIPSATRALAHSAVPAPTPVQPPTPCKAQAPGEVALPPPLCTVSGKKGAEASPSRNAHEPSPSVPGTVQPSTLLEASSGAKDTPVEPVPGVVATTQQERLTPGAAATSTTPDETTEAEVIAAAVSTAAEKQEEGERLHTRKAEGAKGEPTDITLGTSVAETVVPGLRVVAFDVREPSLGAAVVGHVVILEGSCYVWAGTEGTSAQGSLATAVGTRFDGGMPTATPLLAGQIPEDAGVGAGAAGGVSVNMAQRLCKRTGRMVFVSCDLSEDSQILVAAVEAKVIAILKAKD